MDITLHSTEGLYHAECGGAAIFDASAQMWGCTRCKSHWKCDLDQFDQYLRGVVFVSCSERGPSLPYEHLTAWKR